MAKAIRVLQVIPQLGPGGISSVVMNWLRESNEERVKFDFICFNDGPLRAELEKSGSQVFCIPTFRQSPKQHITQVQAIFKAKQGGYDVIHVHNSFKNFVMLGLAKRHGIPVRVCHSHTSGLESTWLAPVFSVIKQLTKKFSNQFVACGDKAGKFLFGDDDFLILNNAIKVEKFLPSKERQAEISSVLTKYHLPSDKQLIIHVGRFSEVKNHQFLLTLASHVNLNKNIHFVCVGDGPLKQALANDIIEMRQTERFSLLPANNDIASLLNAASAFIMPSLFEGISVALLEAQAAKLPCYISDTISLEADIGLALVEFLPLDTPDDWVEQLNHLQPSLLDNDTVKQAFNYRKYSIDTVVEQLLSMYEQGLKAK
ncbi:glycosyltransferase [Thalassotalea sp. LPB0316]|uniref:glycosyltransferase n=1 Tax=Thalassotalea sp. LPB0316 TaxID=2769490 RepID=UPI0018673697|nr:glycosyltransferase [Thalassotalea sp. LPB0316]QOL26573.1 glycosyltransferase [Thalassotalea sp. LPB0316]